MTEHNEKRKRAMDSYANSPKGACGDCINRDANGTCEVVGYGVMDNGTCSEWEKRA